MIYLIIYVIGCFIAHIWINIDEKSKKSQKERDKLKNIMDEDLIDEHEQKVIYNAVKYGMISLSWFTVIGSLIAYFFKDKINKKIDEL